MPGFILSVSALFVLVWFGLIHIFEADFQIKKPETQRSIKWADFAQTCTVAAPDRLVL